MEAEFEQFWSVKPKRKGDNSKKDSRLKFLRLVARGVDPQKIIGSARAWAKQVRDDGKEGTEFVPMAATWLNQERYEDYAPLAAKDEATYDAIAAKHGYKWNGEKYVKLASA